MTALAAGTLRLRTPEGIAFNLALAGPVARMLAWMVDALVIAGLCGVAGTALGFFGLVARDLAVAVMFLAYFGIQFGYAIVLEWFWRGQTLGKRLLRLRVVDATGHKLQFSQVALRNLLRAVDILPGSYLVGGVACLLSRRAQRLGDLAAGTVVIRVPRVEQPDLAQLLAGRFNSLRAHPHLCARLRQQVTPGEAAAALQALVRRDALEPAARVQLFAELAALFRGRTAFPPEAADGLADEQYVRNVVDVLYQTRRAAPEAKPAA